MSAADARPTINSAARPIVDKHRASEAAFMEAFPGRANHHILSREQTGRAHSIREGGSQLRCAIAGLRRVAEQGGCGTALCNQRSRGCHIVIVNADWIELSTAIILTFPFATEGTAMSSKRDDLLKA